MFALSLHFALSLERLSGRIFLTEFGQTFFCRLFPFSFFLGQAENTPGKKPAKTQ